MVVLTPLQLLIGSVNKKLLELDGEMNGTEVIKGALTFGQFRNIYQQNHNAILSQEQQEFVKSLLGRIPKLYFDGAVVESKTSTPMKRVELDSLISNKRSRECSQRGDACPSSSSVTDLEDFAYNLIHRSTYY